MKILLTYKMKYTPINHIYTESNTLGEKVSFRGRIINSNTKSDEIHYYILMDQTGYLRVKSKVSSQQKSLKQGDIIEVQGTYANSDRVGPYLELENSTILSSTNQSLPNNSFFANLQNRVNQKHLEVMLKPNTFDLLKKKSLLLRAFRNYLDNNDFFEVTTGILKELPIVSSAKSFETYWRKEKKNIYLRKAMESDLKKLIIGGFERIYEIGKVFRNEGNSNRHLSELTTVDILKTFSDYKEMILISEDLLNIGAEVFEKKVNISKCSFDDILKDFKIKQDTYLDSFNAFKKKIKSFPEAIIIYDLPVDISPMAKKIINQPSLAEHFMVFYQGLNVMHGYSFETNLENIKNTESIQTKKHRDVETFDLSFQDTLKYGMPPTAGIGLGLERLILKLSGLNHIKDVTLFTV